MLLWLAAAPRPVPLMVLRHAQPLLCDEAAAPSPLKPAYADSDFDRALNGILTDAAKMGLEPALDSWLERLDDVFTACFTLEALVKVLALGFVLPEGSAYLRDPWNVLDFAIVAVSLVARILTFAWPAIARRAAIASISLSLIGMSVVWGVD